MAVYKNEQQQTPEIEPEENWELEADTERPAFSLNHGFYKPTPLRYGLVCFCCKTEGHRHHRCPVREGLPKDFLTPYCERCKKKGHATKHCGKTPIRTPMQKPREVLRQRKIWEYFPKEENGKRQLGDPIPGTNKIIIEDCEITQKGKEIFIRKMNN